MKSILRIGIKVKLLCLQPKHELIRSVRKALSSFLLISIIPRILSILSRHFCITTSLPSVQPLKRLTSLVMMLHSRSSSSTCFQTYIHWNKTLRQISIITFLQRETERERTLDGLGGTVNFLVWRFTSLNAISFSEIACQRNPNINMSSVDIEKKSDEMTEHYDQILPVQDTVKSHYFKTQGPDKLSVSNVSNGETFSIIRILSATDENVGGNAMFDQIFDTKKLYHWRLGAGEVKQHKLP